MKHCLLFLVLLRAWDTQAQEPDTTGAPLSPFLQKLSTRSADAAESVAPGDTAFQRAFAQATKQSMLVNQQAELAQHRYRRATYDYYTQSLRHRARVFNWQHTSGRITFGLVVLITLAGLLFSGIQFYIAMKDAQARAALRRKNRLDPAKDDADDLVVTKLELSLQGVKVNSSVLGVIILVVSLGFFYLYLAFVFPITETNFGASEIRAEKEAIEQTAVPGE